MAECAGSNGTSAVLNGSTSLDPDGDALKFEWRDEVGNVIGNTAIVHVTVPLGTHTFTVTVTDSGGLSSNATSHVTVRDTTPPSLTVSLSPIALWPPNHNLVPITANMQANDICDLNPTVALKSITASQPLTGGDMDGATFGTDDCAFSLKANKDQLYTVTYQARDQSGNTALSSGVVFVPHDQSQH